MTRLTTAIAAAFIAATCATGAAHAEGAAAPGLDPVFKKECGDCHAAFHPSRLTKNGWKKIMADLGNHFGESATLPPETAKHIEDYLVSGALDAKEGIRTKMVLDSWKKKGVVDPIRITETPNWKHEHSGGEYMQMVKDKNYDRGANCIVCHKESADGSYVGFEKH